MVFYCIDKAALVVWVNCRIQKEKRLLFKNIKENFTVWRLVMYSVDLKSSRMTKMIHEVMNRKRELNGEV